MKKTAIEEVLDQAEALCKGYLGVSEEWRVTVKRLVDLDKAIKRARRAQKAAAAKAAAGTDA